MHNVGAGNFCTLGLQRQSLVPILMHWIKVASITCIAVSREYKASLGMMKLVRGLGNAMP